MAKFQLGAIVTAIAGSIGGTTFKRSPQGLIMMNKSRGASSTVIAKNLRLSFLSWVITRWSILSPSQKSQWDTITLDYQFPDKFGVMRILTGRQLFIKLNSQLLDINSQIGDVTNITSFIEPLEVTGCQIDFTAKTGLFFITAQPNPIWLCLAFDVRFRANPPIRVSRRAVIFKTQSLDFSYIEFGDEFFAKYPYSNSSYGVRVYWYTMNPYGFKSPTQSMLVENQG